MSKLLMFPLVIALVSSAAPMSVAAEKITNGPSKSPAWQPPDAKAIQEQVIQWLKEKNADNAARAKAAAIWSKISDDAAETELLSRVTATFALVDEHAAKLCELCSKPKSQLVLSGQDWLKVAGAPRFLAANMRLLYGRWLVQAELYDEGLEQLSGLEPAEVVAPATLLFYRGVAAHSLLEKQTGLDALGKLLEGAEHSPRRYVAVARLVQEDLEGLEDESLDHIARRMNDVRRRLDLGRAGSKVRGVEDGIIASLDKMIKKLEDQQQQNSSANAVVQDNIRSNSPAPDSLPLGGKGPGDVVKRDVGSHADWGNLPPKDREESLQKLGRDFPSHYRDIIEQYFRRLASEGSE